MLRWIKHVHEDIFKLLNSHVEVSRETFGKLVVYHDLLVKWQAKVNLVGPDTVKDAWSRHFLDSIQLIKLLTAKKISLMDIGSGAGFPGMVLAIMGVENVHLVESDQKKIIFLKEVSRETKTPVTFHATRVEHVKHDVFDVIVSRACSSLDTLLTYSNPFVSHETVCLFPKGRNYATELEDAEKHWNFQHLVVKSVTDIQGVVLKISNLRRGYESRQGKKT